MGRGKEDREGGGGTRAASVPTFSGGANVFPTTPQGSIASAGADVSCPLFPPSSGTKTLGTGREGPMEHLGMHVRGGLAGRLPVWQPFQRTGILNVLQIVAVEEGTLKAWAFQSSNFPPFTNNSYFHYIIFIRLEPKAHNSG